MNHKQLISKSLKEETVHIHIHAPFMRPMEPSPFLQDCPLYIGFVKLNSPLKYISNWCGNKQHVENIRSPRAMTFSERPKQGVHKECFWGHQQKSFKACIQHSFTVGCTLLPRCLRHPLLLYIALSYGRRSVSHVAIHCRPPSVLHGIIMWEALCPVQYVQWLVSSSVCTYLFQNPVF